MVLRLQGDDTGAVALAEALLAEGVLQESDWCGSVRTSLAAGIQRWTTALLDEVGLQRIELGLLWTDNVRWPAPGFDTSLWLQAAPGRDGDQPVGMLAIVREPDGGTYPEARDVFVREKVMALEAVRPGLGFQVLFILQEVLPPVVNAATPCYGLSQVFKWEWLLRQVRGDVGAVRAAGIEPPTHGLTQDAYLAEVPLAACAGEVRPGRVREALRHPLPDWARPLAERAWELATLYKAPRDVFRCDAALLCASQTRVRFLDTPGGAAKEAAFGLRWSPRDGIRAVTEDFHRQIRERESETNLMWCQGWQASDPKALRRTARNWKHAVTLALRACRLAELLHTDEAPQAAPAALPTTPEETPDAATP